MALGERAAARSALGPIEAAGAEDPLGREAMRRLAELDEAEGAVIAAAERWERILADDIDDPQARDAAGAAAPHATRQRHRSVADAGVARRRRRAPLPPAARARARARRRRSTWRATAAWASTSRSRCCTRSSPAAAVRTRYAGSSPTRASPRHPPPRRRRDLRRRRERARGGDGAGRGRDAARSGCATIPAACPPTSCARPRGRCWTPSRHVHAAGIVHGDLKPSNLLLRRPGEVVLADFGAAELTGGARASSAARGRRRHAAVLRARAVPRRARLGRVRPATRSAPSCGRRPPGGRCAATPT